MSSSAVVVRHTVGSLPGPDDVITVVDVKAHHMQCYMTAVSDVVRLISHSRSGLTVGVLHLSHGVELTLAS